MTISIIKFVIKISGDLCLIMLRENLTESSCTWGTFAIMVVVTAGASSTSHICHMLLMSACKELVWAYIFMTQTIQNRCIPLTGTDKGS